MQVRKITIVMAMFVGVCGAALAQAPELRFEQPKMEKVTFLGIAMRPLGREEGKKLNLPPGVGVKVDFAEKGVRPTDFVNANVPKSLNIFQSQNGALPTAAAAADVFKKSRRFC